MNNELIYAILSFSTVMLLLNLVKDLIIRVYGHDIPEEHISKSNKRWWIAFTIGIIFLFILYGRAGPL